MEPLPLSLLNDHLYCSRRAALKVIEGWRLANEHTNRGDIVHEHADLAGYDVVKGVTLLRALPVWSERLGLNGRCDIVEVHPAPVAAEVTSLNSSDPQSAIRDLNLAEPPYASSCQSFLPVEFKLGKRRQWENDDAQLCAQSLCLEEMFGITIERGAVFHADSKRRREVEFTAELRQFTESAIAELHVMVNLGAVPPAVFKPACEECSLFDICLPKATCADSRAARLNRDLFKT